MARHGPAAIVVATALYVIVYPFTVTHYPPMTDLPFHAAETSIFRHFWDPNWGFRQQFLLHPLSSPYVSFYGLGAIFALVLPIHIAVKVAAAVMLSLLPIGLAVLLLGMKKTPLWSALGLGVVWAHLTHWGFLNFVGAIGLFAMSLGFTLLVLDSPSRKREVGLCLSLLGVYFTHGFRFPFAIAGVLVTALVAYPATRRFRPLVWPLVPSVALFVGWWLRTPQRGVAISGGDPVGVRWRELEAHLWTGFSGASGVTERGLFHTFAGVALVLGLSSAMWFVAQGRLRRRSLRAWWWGVVVTLLPLAFGGAFLVAYLLLPMRIGGWWYVYPREITTAFYLLLAAVPDMPKQLWFRLPIVTALAFVTGRIGLFVATEYRSFDGATQDFTSVVAHVSPAPRLMYLVFDRAGSTRSMSPFVHLPAWVQAEKGGALSFHFASSEYGPVTYRTRSQNVPPPVPERWEWNPDWFQLDRHGSWFDHFLIRRADDPSWLFASDPSIRPVAHSGEWWLYRRGR